MELKPVDVISVCNANGEIRPLRLRIEDEQQRQFRVDIAQVVSVKEITFVEVEAQVFLCRAWFQGREWLFELKYSIRTHTWRLLQKLV